MRVLICGARDYRNYNQIYERLKSLQVNFPDAVVIEGGAAGADSLARTIAVKLGLDVIEYPANWTRHGRAAGPIRNRRMLEDGRPDEVWAFHEKIEASKGTKDMISQARKASVPVSIYP